MAAPTDSAPARPIHVFVALDSARCAARGILAGIDDVLRHRDDVLLHMVDGVDCIAEGTDKAVCRAAIVSCASEGEAALAVARTAGRCVNVLPYAGVRGNVPVVSSDDAAIGKAVAAYFIERGVAHFAVFSHDAAPELRARRASFVEAVRRSGHACHVGPPVEGGNGAAHARCCPDWLVWDRGTADWLRALPKPVAVFAPSDALASACIIACQTCGLNVPGEVSVVGVGDDECFCLTSRPELSSLRLAGGEIGREAARLLLSMLDGSPAPTRPILLPPADVVTRASSGQPLLRHPDVAAAVEFIERNLKRRLTVRDVVEHLSVSRRALERQFVEALGRTPLEEIRRLRIHRAKQLLMETDLTLADVARECGFIRHQRLANAFKSATGMTPSAFRSRTLNVIGHRS